MLDTNSSLLSADQPLKNPDEDLLGYARFAQALADSICEMIPPEGLVIAVHGSWGAGKTTALEFLNHYLEEKPENERPLVMRFNPWWFSGQEDLTRRFFGQLEVVLSRESRLAKSKQKLLEVREGLRRLGAAVGETPLPGAWLGKAVSQGLSVEPLDLYELKLRISESLLTWEKRILVVIDDIDRLTVEEIRQLFRVIKAVADFPNVIYLLAFDRKVVVRALEQTAGVSGEDYLKKIVQVPFELPLPEIAALSRMFFQKVDVIFDGTSKDLINETHLGNVFHDGVKHFLATPRDVVRFANSLSVTYPPVRNEVNVADFVAIEALRVFMPLVYEIIRKHADAFVGVSLLPLYGASPVEELKMFHDSWLSGIKENERETTKNLLKRIFPKLESVWGNTNFP